MKILYRGSLMKSRIYHRIVYCILFLAILPFLGCPPYRSTPDYTDTWGLARGVDTRGYYAYVADGMDGLKILNISNPMGPYQIGALQLDGFNSRVDVYGHLAAVTDTEGNKVYIIDVQDPFQPRLMGTYNTLDKPVNIYYVDNVLYIAERGDDPQSAQYFSGLEAVVYQYPGSPQQISAVSISEITDVIVPNPLFFQHLYVVSDSRLTVLSSAQGNINASPLSTLNFVNTEQIQSIDFGSNNHLLILGQSLYLMDVSDPANPSVVTSLPVAGYSEDRVVSCKNVGYSIGPWGAPFSSFRYSDTRFVYSTQREIGWGRIDWNNPGIILESQYDIYHDSDGNVKVYDIQMVYGGHYLTLPYTRGEKFVGAVAAMDNYGLGYTRLEEIPFSQYGP